jgi:acyl dehydratase
VPIDASVAIGAALPEREFSWTSSDVLLYHLALGAGADPVNPHELRYAYEADLQVLPTFAVVAPTLGTTEPPKVSAPGIEVDLKNVLHGSQQITVHRALPTDGSAVASSRTTDVWDKGENAVIFTETSVVGSDGLPLWTALSSVFARGEGGFGGERGPSGRTALPDRDPDLVLTTATLPQQALWYRLLGDRNPLHSDPAFAAAAGFPAPILHGLATFGIVCKALVDEFCDSDASRVAEYGVRFAGVVYPGETLRTSVWRDSESLRFVTGVVERDGAAALSDATLVVT